MFEGMSLACMHRGWADVNMRQENEGGAALANDTAKHLEPTRILAYLVNMHCTYPITMINQDTQHFVA